MTYTAGVALPRWLTQPFSRVAAGRPEPARMAGGRPDAQFSLDVPLDLVAAMAGLAPGGKVARNDAMSVPAVMRARNLICGSIGKLPLCVKGPDFTEVPAYAGTGDTRGVSYLVNSPPDPEIPQIVTLAMTVEDMLMEGVGWWQVTRRGWHGYPVEARWVPHGSVLVTQSHSLPPSRLVISPDELFPAPADGGVVYIDGRPVPAADVIRFDSPIPPLLRHAARAIRTCIALDAVTSLYAKSPMPLGFFSPADDAAELTDTEAQKVVDDWAAARAANAYGYVPGNVRLNTVSWNPEQLQLAAQRQHAVLDIARATGVDASYLEADNAGGSTETYANSEDKRQDLVDFTLDPFLTAIEQRLSMRDILPRGYMAAFERDAFVRGDTQSRMQTYQTGLAVGAWTKPEIRRAERKPPLPDEPAPAPQPPAAAEPPMPMPDMPPASSAAQHRQGARVGSTTQHFAAPATDRTVRVQFAAPDADATFQVDSQRRTVTGLMLPWGKIGDNGFAKWRFLEGSVRWTDPSRIKLNLDHDNRSSQLIGVATRLQSGKAGLTGTFKIGRGPEGDRALMQAEDGILDGFSVELDLPDPDSWQPDPTDESVRLVRSSVLRGAAMTGTPAFDDARLTDVKASREGVTNMAAGTATVDPSAAPPATVDFDAHMSALAERIAASQQAATEGLAERLGASFNAAMVSALEGIASPQAGPQAVSPVQRFTITREAPVYSLDGRGHSLVRDAWYAIRERDADATERLRRFRSQTDDLAKFARSALSMQPGRQSFTTSTTSSASQIIPPGYRPDLFVPMLGQGRPMVSACSQGTIENATPFVVPIFGSFTGATGDNTEGVNPTDGSLSFTSKTVTPGAISGRLVLSREIVDASNPAIDQIALASMRESYARQTEAKVYTLLNGANGSGGTITAGFVPSGAQAATFVGGTGTPPAALAGIRGQLAKYPFARFASPSVALMGQNATTMFATAVDTTGRPMFQSVGDFATAGLGNAVQQGWNIDGLPFFPAWAVTGVAATDTQIFILNSADAWVWESPTLLFRFEEKQGPALIELALFGYFATHLLRPVGLSGIRLT